LEGETKACWCAQVGCWHTKEKTLLHAVPLKDQIWVCQRTGALYISLFDSSDCTSPTISIYPNADVAGMHREHDVPTVQSDLLTFLQKDSAVSLAVWHSDSLAASTIIPFFPTSPSE
jgi:hypothetical protein